MILLARPSRELRAYSTSDHRQRGERGPFPRKQTGMREPSDLSIISSAAAGMCAISIKLLPRPACKISARSTPTSVYLSFLAPRGSALCPGTFDQGPSVHMKTGDNHIAGYAPLTLRRSSWRREKTWQLRPLPRASLIRGALGSGKRWIMRLPTIQVPREGECVRLLLLVRKLLATS